MSVFALSAQAEGRAALSNACLRSSGSSAERYIEQLIADGWTLIGDGGYARVLTKDDVAAFARAAA
jgi:hypothetical protein